MSKKADTLYTNLETLGLSMDEIDIFLLLNQKKSLSALQISKDTSLARTKVYRLIDKLITKKLVISRIDDNGYKFEPAPLDHLEMLIAEKESKIAELKNVLPELIEELKTSKELPLPEETKILHYKGLEGLKQITWNSLKANEELLIFEMKDMSAFMDYGFAERVREEYVLRNIHVRELTNAKKLDSWTNIKDFVRNQWECRFLDPNNLAIQFEILVYNNIYTLYTYEDENIVCMEVENTKLAMMQRQLFNYLWNQAFPMQKLSDFGDAEVI